jgi:hypothetical protein
MSLLTFRSARPYAKAIRDKVASGEMPPWHADPRYGTFANDRRLTEAEREVLMTWANTGSREGDPQDLPAPPVCEDTWTIRVADGVRSSRPSVLGPKAESRKPRAIGNPRQHKWIAE